LFSTRGAIALPIRTRARVVASKQTLLPLPWLPRVNQTNRDNHSLRAFSERAPRSSVADRGAVLRLATGNVQVTRNANNASGRSG